MQLEPYIITCTGIWVWYFLADPSVALSDMFWYEYMLAPDTLMICAFYVALYMMTFYTLPVIGINIGRPLANFFIVMSAVIALKQQLELFTYYQADPAALLIDWQKQWLLAPYYITDVVPMCFFLAILFIQQGQAWLLFLLPVLGPDGAFAVFAWRQPYVSTVTPRFLRAQTLLAGLCVGYFLVGRVEFALVPRPQVDLSAMGCATVVGCRLVTVTLTTGFSMLAYMAPHMKLTVVPEGAPSQYVKSFVSMVCTLAVQMFFTVTGVQYVLAIPLYISAGWGLSEGSGRNSSKLLHVSEITARTILSKITLVASLLLYNTQSWPWLVLATDWTHVGQLLLFARLAADNIAWGTAPALFLTASIFLGGLTFQSHPWLSRDLVGPSTFLVSLVRYMSPLLAAVLLGFYGKNKYTTRMHPLFVVVLVVGTAASLWSASLTGEMGIVNAAPCPDPLPSLHTPVLRGTDMSALESFLAQRPGDRGQHNQTLGCASVQFTPLAGIPDRFAVGLFGHTGASQTGVVRFSSVSMQGSTLFSPSSGVRGLALKIPASVQDPLVNFSATFWSPVSPDQDFLFLNRDRFFISDQDLDHYALLAAVQKNGLCGNWVQLGAAFLDFRLLRLLWSVWSFAVGPVAAPLSAHYTSATPYAMVQPDGSYAAVKYELDACTETTVCFDLYVREQIDNCHDPIHDSTVVWTGARARVAEIRGELITDNQCSLLSYNAWHTSSQLAPLGKVNAMRLAAYAGAEYRRMQQKTGILDWSVTPTPQRPAGDQISVQYAQYAGFPWLPRYFADFSIPHAQHYCSDAALFLATAVAQKLTLGRLSQSWQPGISSFESYGVVFGHDKHFPIPGILTLPFWNSDDVFSQQFLSGINAGQLGDGDKRWPTRVDKTSLVQAGVDTRNLLYVDYEILDGIVTVADTTLYPGTVFFRLLGQNGTSSTTFNVVAIVLNGTVYRPDASNTWLYAKMHILQADSTVHEFVSHLLHTHLSAEPVVMAFRRALPPYHPFLTFFAPHFRQLFSINQFGRNTLLAPNGVFQVGAAVGTEGSMQLMQKARRRYDFSKVHTFWRSLEQNGLSLEKAIEIPGHHYARDGLALWGINAKYVKTVVRSIWHNDATVTRDKGLHLLYNELKSATRADIDSIPPFYISLEALENFATQVFYMNTQQHAAVNNEQYEAMAFIPARPLRLRKPMGPEIDEEYILSSLANAEEARTTIDTVRILSSATFTPILGCEVNGELLRLLSVESAQNISESHAEWQRNLQVLETAIHERGKKQPAKPFRYDAISPSRVSMSIDI